MMRQWRAAHYADTSYSQDEAATHFLQKYAVVEGHEDILDVGCGDGHLSAKLAQSTSGKVKAIDPSDNMIKYAQAHHHVPGKCEFSVGDALIHAEEAYDLITSFSALHWLAEHDEMLRRFHAALKPGGKVAFLIWPRGDFAWAPIEYLCKQTMWAPYFTDFDDGFYRFARTGYALLLKHSPFSSYEVGESTFYYTHSCGEDYVERVSSFLPHFDRIPDEKLPLFNEQLAQLAEEVLFKTDDCFMFPANNIEVIAHK